MSNVSHPISCKGSRRVILLFAFNLVCLICLLFGIPLKANAQFGGDAPRPDFGDIQAQYNSYNLDVLGDDLAGDHIDIDTGGLSLTQMDVSIPGNSKLPVEFGRMISRYNHSGWLGGWAPTIPYISRNYLASVGPNLDRCTGDLYPQTFDWPTIPGLSYDITAESFFNGYSLSVPGRNPGVPAQNLNGSGNTVSPEFENTNAVMVTKNNWIISCGVTASDGGEGFVATAPNGDKYTFGFRQASLIRQVTFPAYDSDGFPPQNPNYYFNASATHDVYEEVLYVTEIRDVHDNWVKYEYAGNRPSRIHSNDLREITFGYSGNQISTVTANNRIWKYYYTDNNLSQVTLPDNRSWMISANSFALDPWVTSICAFENSPALIGNVTITHPSGTVVDFEFNVIKNGRTYMQIVETNLDLPEPTVESCLVDYTAYAPERVSPTGFWSFAVTKKTLTLTSGESRVWTREYEQDAGTYTDAGSHPPDTKKRTITDPQNNKTVLYVNRRFGSLEGSLMKTEIIPAGSTTPKQTIVNNYQVGNIVGIELAGQGYRGTSNQSKSTRIYNTQTIISRVEDTYTDTFTTDTIYEDDPTDDDFAYGAPQTTTKTYSTVSGSSTPRTTETTYEHKKTKWILSLPKTVSLNQTETASYTYNPLGQKTHEYRFGSLYATYQYFASGNYAGLPRVIEDAEGRTTTIVSYNRGTARRIRLPDNNEVRQITDNNGWLKRYEDARGFSTTYKHDDMGRLTKVLPSEVNTDLHPTDITYTFNSSGTGPGAVQTIQQQNKLVEIEYDSLFRPVLEYSTDTSGTWKSYVKTEYNAAGQVAFKSLPAATENAATTGTTYLYDGLGRVKSSTLAGKTTSYDYPGDNVTSVTDPDGYVTSRQLNGYGGPGGGELIKITQPESIITDITRNDFGNITEVTQGGISQEYFYDSRQRLCRHRTPEGGDTLYGYDESGWLVSYAKGLNVSSCPAPYGNSKVSLIRNVRGWVTATEYDDPDTRRIARSFDANGNLLTLNRHGVRKSYVYDEYNRLESEQLQVSGETYDLGYIYDDYGGLFRRIVPAPVGVPLNNPNPDIGYRTFTYTPDAFGRPTQAKYGGNQYARNITYHPNGMVAGMNYGIDLTDSDYAFSQTLNDRQLPEELSSVGVNVTHTALDLLHSYNDRSLVDMVTDAVTSANTRTYTYDGAGRLETASGPWGPGGTNTSGLFDYDTAGNITEKVLGNRVIDLTYDSTTNRLTSYTDTDGPDKPLMYDSRGNVTMLGAQTFGYDMSDQPQVVVGMMGGAVTGTYRYDGHGRRAKGVVDGETIYYVYDASGQLMFVDNKTTGEQTAYIHAGGMTVARHTGDTPDGITYLHNDHLGTPVAGTDNSGNVIWREQHSPFGMSLTDNPANDNLAGYTGHVEDRATGLIYMQARLMDPVIGRFLSIDPVTFMQTGNPAMFNRYAYTFNDPINMIDPTGEAGCSVYICGSITTNSDGYVTVRSSPILRSVVPGQVAWDNARTSHANGDTVGAVVGTAAMVGEQVLTVATLGAGTAATQTARVATTQATQKAAPTVTRELTKSQQKSINTLQKRITEHTQKLDDFIANPTVRPGMEGQPASVIKAAQDSRIGHLKKEISTFKNNIRKIEEGLD